MMLSQFFEDLTKAYQAEIEDLQSDSEGNDILTSRLKSKRSQFALMMPMIDTDPEMVAVAFHGGIDFTNPQTLMMLLGDEPEEFPSWADVADAVQFESWAQKLADIALQEAGGERFLITAVCLEYLHEKSNGNYNGAYGSSAADDQSDDAVEGVERDDDDNDSGDLETEGADWLAEQGFERLG
ncbi:hypothetical protein LT85_1880 [Collimonas arenae]|uniref:Uncharacterized protein n=1 Tax=Collimonas arenae TaxID=279058 RepID=A0A0A1F8H6_9BURK|nr:hypothetical protein [Collimonas arenae]AIY41038.1 hypothetical protein LT85_1880 [Collimonas arenae]